MLYLELIIRPTTDDLLQIFDRERWVLYLSCNYMECYFNPIRSRGGGALKAPPLRFFALTHLILELHYCALVTFPQKFPKTPCGEKQF